MKVELTTELIDKLSLFSIQKNHTGRWGALVGRYSANFVFMHEDNS